MGRIQLHSALVLALNVLGALSPSPLNVNANFIQDITYQSKARSESGNFYPLKRHDKREAPLGAGEHDENADIIPEIIKNGQTKNVEQHIKEQVEEVAQNLKQIWQSLEEAARDCAERIKSIFNANDNAQSVVVGSGRRMGDYGNNL